MRGSEAAAPAFPYLLLPSILALRNRTARREKGDTVRAVLFGGIAAGVGLSILGAVFWLTWHLLDYAELGDYLIRLGLSWLFLTFLSFLAFSGVVTALSTFFLSEDLRLMMAAPVSARRMFYARFLRTAVQSGWMVVVFVVPVLLGVGLARCAPWSYYLTAVLAVTPFVLAPVAVGCMVTLFLVNVFPARRARDILMLMGLLFGVAVVLMLRFLQPERLLRVESLPDVTAFFSTLQSPITPLLPSFWAGEALFAALMRSTDLLHLGALWTTALGLCVLAAMAYERFHFAGWSKAQEARKVRFTRLRSVEWLASALPLSPGRRHLLMKDVKVFLRDTTQWSQLLLLMALVLVYVYNFRVLDLDRFPQIGVVIKNAYAFVNLAMAGFVLAAVAVRFVFPAVSAEGPAFWVIRTSPVPMRAFLWSKFWTGLVPIVVMTEALTVVSNGFLRADPFLQVVGAVAIFFMAFALVGLATGMGAIHPRFRAENLVQVAGSYGGIAFMVLAVLFILVETALLAWPSSLYLWYRFRGLPLPPGRISLMVLSFLAAAGLAVAVFLGGMSRGVRAMEDLDREA
jgi:ABC-2 type transport system permease protein